MSTIVVITTAGGRYEHRGHRGRTHDGLLIVEREGYSYVSDTVHCYPLASIERYEVQP